MRGPRDFGTGEDSYRPLPALSGRAARPIRDPVVHHSNGGMFGIRQGQWEAEVGLGSGGLSPLAGMEQAPGGPAGQLYDLSKDPGEQYNLYQIYSDVADRLSTLLEKYKSQGYSRPMGPSGTGRPAARSKAWPVRDPRQPDDQQHLWQLQVPAAGVRA